MVWKVMARDYGDPMPHGAAYMFASVTDVKQILGVSERSWVFELSERNWKWCGEPQEFVKLGKLVLGKLEDQAFFEEVSREGRRTILELRAFADLLRDAPLASYSNGELAEAYEKLFLLWRKASAWGHLVNLSDFEYFAFTNKIMGFLEKRIAEASHPITLPEAFSVLTTPTEKNPLALQDEVFYAILAKIQGNPAARELFAAQPARVIVKKMEEFPEIDRAVHEHAREFDWIQYHYSGPTILAEEYFVEALASEARQGVSGSKKLQELKEKKRGLRERQELLERELGLSEKERYWARVAREFMFLKALRKDVVFQASRNTDSLIKELARRLGVDQLQVRYLTTEESCSALLGKTRVDPALLDERIKYSIWFSEDGKLTVLVGSRAGELAKQIVEEQLPAGGVRELKGTPASPGHARGVVKVIERAEDIPKMRDGDILVSPATNPNLVPAMKKAAAIITDEGGITCHAAIVSRELGIPCVVGLKIATKAFKDGDLVEVDATRGVVRKL